ncbi:hypothetical protein ABPG72_020055 [Tetrahymena utriculariae]
MDKRESLQQAYVERDGVISASHSHEQCVVQLRNLQLLCRANEVFCESGKCPQHTTLEEAKWQDKADGLIFQCRRCRQSRSIRVNSIFSGSKLPLMTLYRCMFVCFLRNMSITEAQSFCMLSESAAKSIYRFCKHQISIHISRQVHQMKLCSDPTAENVIEVDESLFTHLRGDETTRTRHDTQCWIFGMIERRTGSFRCIAVGSDRTAAHLRPILERHVATHGTNKTIVYTDGAAFYSFIDECGYERRIVNHQVGFGRGEETTNHIESLWSQLKSQGRFNSGQNFTTVDQVQHAVNEVCWRVQNRHGLLETLFASLLRDNYRENSEETLVKYNTLS